VRTFVPIPSTVTVPFFCGEIAHPERINPIANVLTNRICYASGTKGFHQ
jgi:hypothetical protein